MRCSTVLLNINLLHATMTTATVYAPCMHVACRIRTNATDWMNEPCEKSSIQKTTEAKCWRGCCDCSWARTAISRKYDNRKYFRLIIIFRHFPRFCWSNTYTPNERNVSKKGHAGQWWHRRDGKTPNNIIFNGHIVETDWSSSNGKLITHILSYYFQ